MLVFFLTLVLLEIRRISTKLFTPCRPVQDISSAPSPPPITTDHPQHQDQLVATKPHLGVQHKCKELRALQTLQALGLDSEELTICS